MSSFLRTLAVGAAVALGATAASASDTRPSTPAPAAAAYRVNFGGAVAVGNGEVFVGESYTQFRPGTVYVFRKTAGTWRQAAKITAPNEAVSDGFGSSLAYDGTNLYVGAGANRVFVYRKQGTNWVHATTVTSQMAGDTMARFSNAIAAGNGWLLIGRPANNMVGRGGFTPPPRPGAPRLASGAVYAFQRNNDGSYSYRTTITHTDSVTAGDNFGAALAMRGNTALIGAYGHANRAGVVYEYAVDASGNWVQRRSFAPTGVGSNDAFGSQIAIHDNHAVIAAANDGNGYGAAYIYRKVPTGGGRGGQAVATGDSTWMEVGRIASPSGMRNDRFGTALAIDDREVWVGAPGAAGNGGVFVFSRDTIGMKVGGEFMSPGKLENGGSVGSSLALRGNVAAVGAPAVSFGQGGVIIYERNAAGNWIKAPMLKVAIDEIVAMTGKETQCAEGKVGVFDCGGSSLVAFIPPSKMTHDGHYMQMNDIWGWTDPVTKKEWALVGRRDGMSLVDISNPSNPVPVADMPMTPGSTPQAWRDMKVYKDHMYVVADNSGNHGMQVFDLKRLRTLKPQANGRPTMVRPDTTYHEITSAHNIVINEESGYAYSVGSGGLKSCGGGLHMIDIRDPKKPTFAGCFSDTGTGRSGTGYSHDAQCVTYKGPDTRYKGHEICIGSNETAISIADVTDKAAPKKLSHASYPNVAYAHQGWLTDDHKFFYLDDEIDELQYAEAVPKTRTLVWDLTDLENPRLANQYMGVATSSDHNLYVLGNQVFQANYMSGLRILDIQDPVNPKEVGFFDTDPFRPNTPGYSGAWSVYPYFKSGNIIVNSIESGLFIVKQTPRTVF